MAKQTQAPEVQSDKKNRPKTETGIIAQSTGEWAGLTRLPSSPIGLAGGDSIKAQAARLSDRRLQTAQRQALAAHIGRAQGNRHLQRVRAALESPVNEASNTRAAQVQLASGDPLKGEVRSQMEAAFGQDFSQVRVHTDTRVGELARGLDARAFTIGSDIAFRPGEYQPGTPIGDALIAHELAHVAQQRGPQSPVTPMLKGETDSTTYNSLEKDADLSAIQAVGSIWARLKGAAANIAQTATPRLMSGLRLQRCSGGSTSASAKAKKVEFTGSHPLTLYGSDPKAKPTWSPGATDHAVAYTKGTNPTVNAQFELGGSLPDSGATTASVRVKEGSTILASQSGIALSSSTVDVTGLALTGLSDSGGVRSKAYSLEWEGSTDGATWTPLVTTGPHLIYWLYGPPVGVTLYNLAAEKVTRYAAGASSVGAVGDALRHGPRGIDGLAYDPADAINADPLSVLADGVGICTDYANLLTFLALSAGLTANTVMFWGGFQSLGKNIWVALGGAYGAINMVNVKSPNPAYNVSVPPISPMGWPFNYHAISRIGGTLQDAALDRQGYDAQAAHDGKTVRLLEPDAASLPDAKKGKAYSKGIPRKDHTVGITVRDYGPQLTSSVFSTDVYVLFLPPAAPLPFETPVIWALDSGSLPPGLSLSAASGLVSGTPTKKGTYAANIKVAAPPAPAPLTNVFPVSIKVKR